MTRDTIFDMSSSLSRPVVVVEVEVVENPTLFCPISSNLLLVEVSPRPRPRLAWLLLPNTPDCED